MEEEGVEVPVLRECFYCGYKVERPCISEWTAGDCANLHHNLKTSSFQHGGSSKDSSKEFMINKIKKLEKEKSKKIEEEVEKTSKPTGGPSSYYDLPSDLRTLNDLLEYLSVRWGKYALHWKDIMKAGVRFGTKNGTDTMYDAKKVVYFGARLILMIGGKKAVREYLEELLNDKQFKD